MTSLEAELRELRRRRRTRRIAIAVACAAVLILGAVWLTGRNSTMTCDEWQTQYTEVVRSGSAANGTRVLLEQSQPDDCPMPSVSGK